MKCYDCESSGTELFIEGTDHMYLCPYDYAYRTRKAREFREELAARKVREAEAAVAQDNPTATYRTSAARKSKP